MENYEGSVMEAQSVDVNTPQKKKGVMKFIIIGLMVIIVLAAAAVGVFLYMRSSPQVRHISKEALIVAKVDLPRILLKMDMKKGEVNEDLREILEELNMEDLLDDPASTGLITAKPSYFFIEYDTKEETPIYYLVAPIANGDKLAKFTKKITPMGKDELEVESKGGKYMMETDGAVWMWNKNSLIIAMSDTMSPDDIEKRVKKYLDQPKSASIANNKHYRSAMSTGHDISFWANLDGISDIAIKGFNDAKPNVEKLVAQRKEREERRREYYNNWDYYYYYGYFDYPESQIEYPQNMFESILLDATTDGVISPNEIIDQLKQFDNSSLLVYADFHKGRMVTGTKSYLSDEQLKRFHGILKDLASLKKLSAHVPKDGLIATAGLQMNYNKLWSITEKQIKELVDKQNNDDLNSVLKHAKTLCDGSMLLSMNVPGKNKEPYFCVVASTAKNKGMESLMKQLAKDGEVGRAGKNYVIGDVTIFFVEDAMVLTSNYREYKKSEHGLDGKQLKRVDSKPLGFFFDVVALLDVAGKNMDNTTEDILEAFESFTISTKASSGVPSELIISANMVDKKANSLKVMWNIVQNQDDFLDGFLDGSRYGLGNKAEQPYYVYYGERDYCRGY